MGNAGVQDPALAMVWRADAEGRYTIEWPTVATGTAMSFTPHHACLEAQNLCSA